MISAVYGKPILFAMYELSEANIFLEDAFNKVQAIFDSDKIMEKRWF